MKKDLVVYLSAAEHSPSFLAHLVWGTVERTVQ